MKLHYYPDTDSLYIELNAGAGTETREIADGVNVDFGAKGEVVGIDIYRASLTLDLSTLETSALPVLALDEHQHNLLCVPQHGVSHAQSRPDGLPRRRHHPNHE